MTHLRHLSPRPRIVVDQDGVWLSDKDGNVLGHGNAIAGRRVVYALPTNITGGNPSQRYRPPMAPGERSPVGMDFSNIVPVGVGIASCTLQIFTNTVPPVETDAGFEGSLTADFATIMTFGQPQQINIEDRFCWVWLNALDQTATDYQFLFEALDNSNAAWTRTALLLCTVTS